MVLLKTEPYCTGLVNRKAIRSPSRRRGSYKQSQKGNIESSELYVHVKPALGGIFTDVVMWIFCPFNGPATLKIGLLTVSLNTLHSGGGWVDVSDL
ncbi:hypothetical protein YC2023_124202 [Brassica napus]